LIHPGWNDAGSGFDGVSAGFGGIQFERGGGDSEVTREARVLGGAPGALVTWNSDEGKVGNDSDRNHQLDESEGGGFAFHGCMDG
jgi:hypothetical protein